MSQRNHDYVAIFLTFELHNEIMISLYVLIFIHAYNFFRLM